MLFRVEQISEKLSTANVNNVQERIAGVAKSQSPIGEYQEFQIENNETNLYNIVPTLQTEYEYNPEYQFDNQTDTNPDHDEYNHELADFSSNNKESIGYSDPAVYAIVQKKNKFVSESVYASVTKNKQ